MRTQRSVVSSWAGVAATVHDANILALYEAVPEGGGRS
jgi:hypothetical protein